MKKIILILMIITAFISYLRANAVGIIQNIPAPTNLKLGIINNPEVDGKTTPGPWPRIKTVYWPDGSKTANYKTIQIPISWTLPSRIKAAHFTIDSNKQLHAQPSVKGYFEEIQVRIESPQKPDWNQWVTIKGGDFCPDDPDQKVWMLRPARSGYDIAITEDLNPKKPIPIIALNNNDAGTCR